MTKAQPKPFPGNEPLAHHLCGTVIRAIKPQAGAAPELPDKLVIPPGNYRLHGKTYSLKAEGLYRFMWPQKSNHQRIVYRKDPLALISALCWIQTHGNRDDRESYESLMRIAMSGKLIMTCGPVSNFAQWLFTQLGLQCRAANTLTLSLPPNDYDMGHVMLEVRLKDKWTLIDVDVSLRFYDKGKPLSLLEFSQQAKRDTWKSEAMARQTGLAVCAFSEQGYDYTMLMEDTFCTEEVSRRWYRRITQVPFLDRCAMVATAADRRRIEQLYPTFNLTLLTPAEFRRRFYPDGQ